MSPRQSRQQRGILIKSDTEIEAMRAAGQVVARVLAACSAACTPGATTASINALAESLIDEAGAEPLFRWYPTYRSGEGFPAVTCISVNEEIVHGIPGPRVIAAGDAVSIDCGVRLRGWCADAAVTVGVPGGAGQAGAEVADLLATTRALLETAIELVAPGRRWSDIARVMEQVAVDAGYGIVREYVGHGIGREMHESPKVPNFVTHDVRSQDFVLEEGMVLAIEPMLALGTGETLALEDGWTVVTRDRRVAAHEEHTVAVGAKGADVLTRGERA